MRLIEYIRKGDALAKIETWIDTYSRSGDQRTAAIIEGVYNSIDWLKTYTIEDFRPRD